jgi:6-phosphofructokinase 2
MEQILTLTLNPAIDVSTSVDRVQPTYKLRCSTQQRDPGGGGINVARVVRRLGGDVSAIYTCGGATGQLLCHLVEKEQIPSYTSAISEETREDFTVYERDTGQQFRFVLPGPPLSEPEWRSCLDTLASIKAKPAYLVASGSLPPGVPVDLYARVSRIAREWGTKLVLDTSGPPLVAALQEGVYLAKPNLRELSEFVGRSLPDEADWVEAGSHLIDKGYVEILALTLGHRGGILFTRDAIWRSPPVPISTVGAGDSFLGGMVFALAGGQSLVDAFRSGIAAGSAALLQAGTELCHREDLERLYRDVTAVRI